MSLTTPLNKVLGLGTAKSGVEHWWAQRLTAVALAPLGLWFAIAMLRFETLAYAEVVAWLRDPVTAILLLMTIGIVVYHSYLGVQAVVEDYVESKGAKLVAVVSSAFGHVFLLVAAVFAVLKVAFGGA
ncbi:MAG TPA: succinate dehydrogenase, hydrophobic membrane anchor protein [Gammaproteobacteria bacterium]